MTGAYIDVVEKEIVGLGLASSKVVNLGEARPDRIFEKVLELTPKKCLVFGIGNIVGYGESIVIYFKNRGEERL